MPTLEPNFDRKRIEVSDPEPGHADASNSPDGLISSPEINTANKPTQRAIRDDTQAREVVSTIIEAGRTRQSVNGRLMAKYNAERPHSQAKLKEEGQGWRSNFTTKPLPSLAEKVYPRLTEAVNGLKYFTNSKLSPRWQNNVEKSEAFQKGITKVIRSRAGWSQLLDDLAFETSFFGHAVLAWLDEYSFFPTLFRQDQSYLPDGTKQLSSDAQVVVLRETYLPHELFSYVKNKDAAKKVGWDLSATRNVINNASPAQLRDSLNQAGSTDSWHQHAIRELNVGASFQRGANVIQCFSLLVREVTGKISHYRLAGTEMALIFASDDRFDSMEECVAFFSYQLGNSTMHGSKGIGRDLYELSGMLDKIRNETVDRCILSGKVLVQGDPRQLHKWKMSLIGMMAHVPTGWTFLETKVDGNIEPFLKLDAYFSQIADQLVGAVSVPKIEGEAFRSPQAWQLLAEREEEQRDSKLSRFLKQFVVFVQGLQRRICAKSTDDADAKEFRESMLKIMSQEELDELAKQPVADAVRDLTPLERQLTAAVAAEKRGNPLYNQRALEVGDITARLGADAAQRLILPENDPTQQAEQSRQQQIEFSVLSQGQPVPVSPRDNHQIHLATILPLAQAVAQAVAQGSAGSGTLEAVLAHITEHYNLALQQGIPKEQLKAAEEIVKASNKVLTQLKALDAEAEQVAAETAQLPPEEADVEQPIA